MKSKGLDGVVEVLAEGPDSVTVRIPGEVLGSRLSWVRYAKPTLDDIRKILILGALAFTPEEGGTQDHPETREGIERFLNIGGEVLIISRDNGFLEKIPLEKMLGMAYNDLPASSPLRQIAEKDVLQRAKSDYVQMNRELWYIHGVGTAIKRLGDGSTVTAAALRTLLYTLVNEQEVLGNKIHFGYIDIGPTRDSINIPSFRLFTRLGGVIDGYEIEVYQKGVPYLRVSHGADYNLSQDDKKTVDLSRRNYKRGIRKALDTGYIGAQISFNRQTNAYSIVFQKQINK